uniref:Large ribosomal subunit protein bL32c n=1 Tax=Dasyclonium flaccidum TaxID=2007274 RepID=A0A1Z1MKE1_9FLOR|nr:ribosomal protein L32 [Dasyclonium flaccidum]ARW66547.1 ribosomal protein L32 [Dasyclonium flaccidum]
MAVPKKRTSKSKSHKSYWKNKALLTSKKSLSLAKSLLTGKFTNFVYYKSINDNL